MNTTYLYQSGSDTLEPAEKIRRVPGRCAQKDTAGSFVDVLAGSRYPVYI